MSQYVYLILNLGSISIPLLYSIFEKKFHFIQYFKKALLSIILVAIPFLIWDAVFTAKGIWGFNSAYHLPFKLLRMPIEEWMFFICIPYACLFTHEVLKYYKPNLKFSKIATILIGAILLLVVFFLWVFNINKWYTAVNFFIFLMLLAYALLKHITLLQEYLPSFLVILIPFFLVNGILTGSFIDEPVVWYDNTENLNFRIFTIPLEDVCYAFNLLFGIQLIFNHLKRSKIGF